MNRPPDTPEEVLANLAEKKPRPDICQYVAPQDQLEEVVCQLWADILRVEKIGREDDVLDLGGESFHMLLVGARLKSLFGVEIQIGDFFEHTTVAAIARYLRDRVSCTSPDPI